MQMNVGHQRVYYYEMFALLFLWLRGNPCVTGETAANLTPNEIEMKPWIVMLRCAGEHVTTMTSFRQKKE